MWDFIHECGKADKIMDYLSKNISINLKKLRLGKKMSLDDVAEQTGVSKSMLGQIERGDSNPTISTIGKIVSGLRVTVDDLIASPSHETYLVKKEKLTPAKEITGQYTIYNYFPFDKNREFEIYNITIEPDGIYQSGSHGERTMEYLVVTKGVLTLKVGDDFYEVCQGDAIRFESDKEHSYMNNGKEQLCFECYFVFKQKF